MDQRNPVLLVTVLALAACAAGCGENTTPSSVRTPCVQQGAERGPTCVGAAAPAWRLRDIQPASDRFGETYGPSALSGKPLVVVLLSSWCSFCRGQAAKLQQLQEELRDDGQDVTVVAINSIDGAADAGLLVAAASFPILQDTPDQRAWEAHEGGRDDFYLYDADGRLAAFLPYGEGVALNLSQPQGYENLKQQLLALQP